MKQWKLLLTALLCVLLVCFSVSALAGESLDQSVTPQEKSEESEESSKNAEEMPADTGNMDELPASETGSETGSETSSETASTTASTTASETASTTASTTASETASTTASETATESATESALSEKEHFLKAEAVRTSDSKKHFYRITYWVLEKGKQVTKTKDTEPEDHEWVDVIGAKENKDATCTAKGAKKQMCYACGVTQVIDIPQKAHTLTKVAKKAAAICVDAGNEEYYKCSCGALFEDAAGTKKLDKIPVIEPAHKNHQLSYMVADGAVKAPATCTEDGYVHPICRYCKKIFDKEADGAYVLKATGHDFPAWDSNEVKIVLPTCYLDGYKVRHCRNQNCQEQEVLVIKSKGHDWATAKDGKDLYFPDPENPATCTKPGNVIRVCKNGCGMNISEAVDSLGHTWGKWTYTYPTTDAANDKWACEQPTTRTHKCTVCGEKETETVFAPVGHNWYVYQLNEKTGETTMKCVNCGKTEVWPKTPDEVVIPVDEQTTPADKTTPAPTPIVKSEEAKSEEPKSEEPKSEEPKSEEPKSEEPKSEEPKSEEPKTEEPSEEPAPVPAPAASRTQARIFEEDTFTVQTLKKGGTYKLPIIDSFGNVVGTLVITVDADQLVASYKVTDTKGKDLKLDADDFCVRVYNNLADAQALNENFVHWGCGEKVYGVNLDADYALVYMIVDYMIL